MEAITNAMRKTMKAYRLIEFDKFLAVANPANDIDFVKEISLYIIRLIFVICFVSLYILYIQHCFQVNGHWSSNPNHK